MGNIVYDLKKKKTIWPTMQAAKTLEKKKKKKEKDLSVTVQPWPAGTQRSVSL